MSQHENASKTTNTMQPNTSQRRQPPQRGKGRKFFQHLQPTFAIEVPTTTTTLQFLDEYDPKKDTIVRKKAREWVNKNRDVKNQDRQRQECLRAKNIDGTESKEEHNVMQLQQDNGTVVGTILSPVQGAGIRQFDPFNIFPDVGRKHNHIIEFCKFKLSCLRLHGLVDISFC